MKKLTKATEKYFKTPFGRIAEKTEALVEATQAQREGCLLISVGDSCAEVFLTNGVKPDILVYDEFCQRQPITSEVRRAIATLDTPITCVKNPPGHITDELEEEIENAIKKKKGKIFIEGEEDLAVLPAAIFAPLGSLIAYGQPNEGMVLVEVTPELKKKAKEIYSKLSSKK